MNKRRIKVTTNQLDKLMMDIRALPNAIIGDHLSDDEFIGYSMQMLAAEEAQRVNEHLASCLDCAAEMGRLLAAADAWSGERGTQQVANQRARAGAASAVQRIQPILSAQLKQFAEQVVDLFRPPALIEAAKELCVDSPPDDLIRLRITQDKDRNLIVRFGSHALELEGARLRLSAGSWQREVVLDRVEADQLGAEIEISQAERQQFPVEAAPQIEFVQED